MTSLSLLKPHSTPSEWGLQTGIWINSRNHKKLTGRQNSGSVCPSVSSTFILRCCSTLEPYHFALFWLMSTAAQLSSAQTELHQLSSLPCVWFLFLLCHLPLPRGTATTSAREHSDFKKGRRGAAGITFWSGEEQSLMPIVKYCIQSFKERQKGLGALWSLHLGRVDFGLPGTQFHWNCC